MAHKYNLHVSLNFIADQAIASMQAFMNLSTSGRTRMLRMPFTLIGECGRNGIKNISPEKLSFDLLNEPAYIEDMNDQFAQKGRFPGDLQKGCRGASKVIWKANKSALSLPTETAEAVM